MIPETLSHYRVVEKLGAGAMGEVYLAEDTKLDRTVALKILPPEFAENPERLERFVREAKAASAIQHATTPTRSNRTKSSSPSARAGLERSIYDAVDPRRFSLRTNREPCCSRGRRLARWYGAER